MPGMPLSFRRARVSSKAGVGVALLVVGTAVTVAAAAILNLTMQDFHVPGTQMGDISPTAFETSDNCRACHGNYDPAAEPYFAWKGSLMGNAGRDPLFYAQMATANQDVANAGYYCMRCHVPMSIVTGHAAQTLGNTLNAQDLDGVTCNFCHSMVDPIYRPGVSPAGDQTILAGLDDVPQHYGNSMFVLDPTGLRRGPFSDSVPPHDAIVDPFMRSSNMCGTCHEVGNLAVSRRPDGTYRYNPIGEASPSSDPHTQFPLERTFSEWKLSAFAQAGGVDMGGRFGGAGATSVSTCQDCHMPKVAEGKACFFGPTRPKLATHDFAGAAAQVLDVIAHHYADDPSVNLPAIAVARTKAVDMLQRAATLQVSHANTRLNVRVVNESGHKLPTGHIEGRRVWVNVKFLDASGSIVREHGQYDYATAELDEHSTRVYEMHVGLSPEASALTGVPAGPSGRMALADTIYKDNRIPPRGFANAAYEAAGAPVVEHEYADGQYWDDVPFTIPVTAVRASVAVYYQNTPKHYIEMLRDNNTSNSWGDDLYNAWAATGKGAPIEMVTSTLTFGQVCHADIDSPEGSGDPDGAVTIDDLLAFLFAFEQGTSRADLDDGSGTGAPDAGVTVDDLLFFLVHFEAGC
jgi:hypothetical protein